MSFRRSTLSIVSIAVLFAGCTGAPQQPAASPSSQGSYPITIKNCSMEITINQKPTRAVALNQGSIEQLLTLGVESQMAGTAYLDNPVLPSLQEAYKKVPVLADKYPSSEVFLAAKPDLAIASYSSAFGDEGVGDREELKAQGIATYIDPFGCPNKKDVPQASFDSVWASMTELAKIFGDPEKANQVITEQKSQLDSIKKTKAAEGKKIFWWDSATDSPFSGAGHGGPQAIIDAVSGTNIFADVEGNWAETSWEQVLAANPDVIVLADASWDTAKSKIDYISSDPALKSLKAVKAKAFVTVPFSQSTPGATLINGAQSVSDQISRLK